MPNFLAEIGTEELPLAGLDVVYEHLGRMFSGLLRKNRLTHGEVKTEATPRRIAFFVEKLPSRQEDEVSETIGPSCEKAFDADGKPTPALEGFLRNKAAKLKDVAVKEIPKGKFVYVSQRLVGKPVSAIMPSLVEELLLSLPFPKSMRWESSGFRFPRPIRWMVLLLDKKVLPLCLADVKSGKQSLGHRFLFPRTLTIREANWDAYRVLLGKAHVALTLKEREDKIRRQVKKRFGQRAVDEELIHTTAHLVEEPFFLDGGYSKTYLDLPGEVLAGCMKKNQKIFADRDSKGRLTNRFMAVLNGKRRNRGRIRFGYENVLDSRLRDARYFYEADTKEPIEAKLPLLGQIVFLGELGSMLDKTGRLEKLARAFTRFGEDLSKFGGDLARAARLSKIDLITQLVYEFPDLQGVVGKEYALEAGEKEEIAKAIGSQYLPKNLGEDYRDLRKEITPLGALFGIIDRLDLLVGAFGTGIEPSGSQDPFALRRAGGTLVKLVRAFRYRFSLAEAVRVAVQCYGSILKVSESDICGRLKEFLKERVIFETEVKAGTRPYEILQAIFATPFDDLADVFDRYDQLIRLYENEPKTFLKAAKVAERTANILKGVRPHDIGGVNSDLFQTEHERRLFRLLESHGKYVLSSIATREYNKAAAVLAEIFYQPVHDFFEQVLVNVEDPTVRSNRQALMKRIHELFANRLADLSILSRLDKDDIIN